ncbi:MAG: S-layer homology domain-containing protein [Clostridia bacterium]|nr:S-layer homology domain-containing protein [Clostridia bacterium]
MRTQKLLTYLIVTVVSMLFASQIIFAVPKLPDYELLQEKYESQETQEQVDTGFKDVEAGSWYADAVKFVTEKEIMVGTPDGLFNPYDEVSRGMFISVLYRITDNKVADTKTTFSDLDEEKYYFDPVTWGYARGIIDGSSTDKFEPNEAISREQLISFLYRFERYDSYLNVDIEFNEEIEKFSDFDDISEYAVKPMKWAYTKGLIQGRDDNTLAPKSSVTRAEAAIIVLRYMNQ